MVLFSLARSMHATCTTHYRTLPCGLVNFHKWACAHKGGTQIALNQGLHIGSQTAAARWCAWRGNCVSRCQPQRSEQTHGSCYLECKEIAGSPSCTTTPCLPAVHCHAAEFHALLCFGGWSCGPCEQMSGCNCVAWLIRWWAPRVVHLTLVGNAIAITCMQPRSQHSCVCIAGLCA